MPFFNFKILPQNTPRLLVVVAFVLLLPLNVIAVSVSEYQQNLKNAVSALEKLYESEEDETSAEYQKLLNETIDGIKTNFPKTQAVQSGDYVYNLDNSWLHSDLDQLKNEEIDRYAKCEQIIDTLKAIEARVTERVDAGPSADKKQWAKNRLESILARPEYTSASKGPNALTRLIRDFLRWLQKFLPKRGPAQQAPSWLNLVAKIGVVAAGLALILFLIKILTSRFMRTGKIKTRKKTEPRIVLGERLEPEQTSTDLLSEAEALARQGELRAAIRKGYIALLVELGERKMLSLAQHKTNRDYLNAVRDVPQLHSRMRGLTDSFERHWYGFVNATENDWQDFRNGYLAALQSGH